MVARDSRRYSKVSRRVWNDARFRSLSAPPPNGQTLWLRLLTGPELTVIPGVIPAGEAGLAEAIGWDLEGFREAFREVFREGLAEADWKARLIWVPKAIEHNDPESPNVVKSWAIAWDEVPECDLKIVIWQALHDHMQTKGGSWFTAFNEACPKPFGKASRKPLAKAWANQEQEQEQEQEEEGGTPLTPLRLTAPDSVAVAPGQMSGPVEPAKSDEVEIPAKLDTPKFREAWRAWFAYRREAKLKPWKPATQRSQLEHLASLGVDVAVAAIERAIREGWQGIHASPPRASGSGAPRAAPPGLVTSPWSDDARPHGASRSTGKGWEQWDANAKQWRPMTPATTAQPQPGAVA